VKDGQSEKAVQHFRQMQWGGMCPDKFTFVPVIKACAGLESLWKLQAYSWTDHSKWSQIFVGNSLVDMYAKCLSTEAAWQVFNKMPSWNVVTWTLWDRNMWNVGKGRRHWIYFKKCSRRVCPTSVNFVAVLNACTI
jgi:pentatricopeptide repeat protein